MPDHRNVPIRDEYNVENRTAHTRNRNSAQD